MQNGNLRFITSFLILNVIFVLPGWIAEPGHHLIPPFMHLSSQGIYDGILYLLFRRESQDILRLHLECFGAGLLIIVMKKPPKVFLSISLFILFFYEIYDKITIRFKGSRANFFQDYHDAKPLFVFLWEAQPILLLTIPPVLWLIFKVIHWLIKTLIQQRPTSKVRSNYTLFLGLLTIYCFTIFGRYDLARRDLVLRSTVGSFTENIEKSIEEQAIANTSLVVPPFPPLEELQNPPDIFLFVVESYGSVLYHDSRLRDGFKPYIDRVEAQLSKNGFEAVSRFSEAPVFGGRSWLSLATILSGRKISNNIQYRSFTDSITQWPHLANVLNGLNYNTIALFPANRNRLGIKNTNLYGTDHYLDGDSIPYSGPPIGFGKIPDHHSLDFSQKFFKSPNFMFFMTVSSHAPWRETPDFSPYNSSLGGKPRSIEDGLYDFWGGFEDIPRGFLKSIQYEWTMIKQFILSHKNKNSVFIVVGDHQPHFARQYGLSTPVHFISSNPKTLHRLFLEGFAKGLTPSPEGSPTSHEAINSLTLYALAKKHTRAP